jgi:DeoR family fructose operon transcriptional repressor
MLAAARYQRILELLQQQGTVKVTELSERFGVTSKTIREDLEKLEEKALLKRIHGGAVSLADGVESLLPLQIPNRKHLNEKEAIAAHAVRYIRSGDIIALDAGSTTFEIARRIPNEPLTVLTNDLLIIRELAVKDQIRLVVPGGYQQRNVLVGNDTLDWLERLNVQKLFLSTTGVHEKYGFTLFNTELMHLKKAFIHIAKEVYGVADHSKFDKAALLTFAALDEIDVLITDDGIDNATQRRYEDEGGIRIERAK